MRITIIYVETCDPFFSLYIFITCGNSEAPVKIPATTPTTFVKGIAIKIVSILCCYKKARRDGLTLTPKPYCL